MRCQVQLVIIKQLEQSKGQIKNYVPIYEPKSNIVQVNNFQKVLFYHIFIGKFARSFFTAALSCRFFVQMFDKSVNKIDLFIITLFVMSIKVEKI